MSILSRILSNFRPKPEAKAVPKAAPETAESSPKNLRFPVQEGRLSLQAESLEEYYSLKTASFGGQEILDAMIYAEDLLKDDQTSLDKDTRPGYLDLPGERFVSTPESGYTHLGRRVHLHGDSHQVKTLKVENGYGQSQREATWDKDKQLLSLSFVAEEEILRPSMTGQVMVSTNIDQSTEPRVFQRAHHLVEQGEMWEKLALGLDGSEDDINPVENSVVAVGLSKDRFAAASSSLYSDDTHLDFEANSDGFVVNAQDRFGNRPFGTQLRGRSEGELQELVLEQPQLGTLERVTWNLSDGVLHYEKRKKG